MNMKIIITESQLKRIISENDISVSKSPSDNEKGEYMITHKGAEGKTKQEPGPWTFCMGTSRETFWKLKERGEDVKYVQGEYLQRYQNGNGGYGLRWINHAWNLIDGIPVDLTYGKNDGEYRGYVIKDEYMAMLPDWADPNVYDYKEPYQIDVLKETLVPVMEK